jgi:hypothetical protein
MPIPIHYSVIWLNQSQPNKNGLADQEANFQALNHDK